MDSVDNRIKQVMADVFGLSENDITQESSQDSIEMWDSMRHLDLVIALEEEFSISIPVEEVGNLISFKLISIIIKELLNK